ncbi:hypothetical protein PF008_g5132 [Phytophthora fragariae]|uniref:Uncharacterized protein n=1 Tax=Phytophthora fragariae TaxID=53985 RepID=A0A6G0SAZ1_9STRA|nr:hypothetical protein PF008_g5132 [Phytophthora fragariae]
MHHGFTAATAFACGDLAPLCASTPEQRTRHIGTAVAETASLVAGRVSLGGASPLPSISKPARTSWEQVILYLSRSAPCCLFRQLLRP